MSLLGRPVRYRERIEFETRSVEAKGIRGLMVRTLRQEYGCSRIEAEALADRSQSWLRALGLELLPGQVRLDVPAGPSRRYARVRRRAVVVTAVDVGEDGEVWRRYGLAALQRRRLLRWMMEIHRQGGCASLSELAAWANLTPTALGERLAPVRELGIWLPHVGGPACEDGRLGVEAWLVESYLRRGQVEPYLARFGLTPGAWEAILRRFVQAVERVEAGEPLEGVAAWVGLSVPEVRQLQEVAQRHRRSGALRLLRRSYGGAAAPAQDAAEGIEAELIEGYRLSPVAARAYRRWLEALAERTGGRRLADGELLFYAISADAGARARLAEAPLVPVRLPWFTGEDAAAGPYGAHRTRVADLKFGRILRYATAARAQGALLTLPDLAMLMGIAVDAVRHHLAAHPEVVVPTRGRVKDIGRGVTHRTRIVELYLQMHTETEIVDRTGHSYESVENYLREFARVVTLADRGLNAVMIRRVTGRSLSLVTAYLELYRRYEQPDHHFRLAQLRHVFAREELLGEKKGRRFRSPTEGAAR